MQSEQVIINGGASPEVSGPGRFSPISAISAKEWFAIAKWAKQNGHLTPFQRSLSYSLGLLAAQDKKGSDKQIKYGLIVLEEAKRLGFKIDP